MGDNDERKVLVIRGDRERFDEMVARLGKEFGSVVVVHEDDLLENLALPEASGPLEIPEIKKVAHELREAYDTVVTEPDLEIPSLDGVPVGSPKPSITYGCNRCPKCSTKTGEKYCPKCNARVAPKRRR